MLLASLWIPDPVYFRLLLPEFIILGAILALMLAATIFGRDRAMATMIALAGAVGALVAAVALLGSPDAGLFAPSAAHESAGQGAMLEVDGLFAGFRVVLYAFLAAIVLLWRRYDDPNEPNAVEFLTLLLASAMGMSLMAASANLLLMVIAIELASMPSFALAGFDRSRRPAAEASLKYALFGSIATGFMVFGVSLLFVFFGTLHVPTLAEKIIASSTGPIVPIALLAVFVGIGFKVSAVPFHFWCPDVFEGASLPVATWLSVASKAAAVVLLLRFAAVFSTLAPPDSAIVQWISGGLASFAMLTITFCNLAAFRQTNVRRLLAYSSMAHAGYLLAAGAVLQSPDSTQAAQSAVLQYLVIYVLMNLGAFLALALVAEARGSENMEAFSGLGWRAPTLAISLTACLFSLVGLPPLGGFVAKFWLISAVSDAASTPLNPTVMQWLQWLLIATIVINTAISLYYYGRIIRQMYFVDGSAIPLGRIAAAGNVVVALCATALLLTGTVLAGPLKTVGDRNAGTIHAARTNVSEIARSE